MFVEEKTQGEVVPVKVGSLKMSAAMRIGCPYVQEHRLFSGCAIGTAYKALTGLDLADDYRAKGNSPFNLVANAFSIPREIVVNASNKHFFENKSREEVADWLESKGY